MHRTPIQTLISFNGSSNVEIGRIVMSYNVHIRPEISSQDIE